ncbi:hypothetical protein [Asticcacaulis taihuensis]|uniref:hypothetical protein n=1 Tax=Asticcacaulis taihuensis TaxID=260084 RepID=UPI0026ED1566|nr:hypothetical protein [Asticcacaulis taihuensis]
MRIFSYRGAVVAAKHFGDALDVLGIDSAAGVFDISGGLKTVRAEILAAYLPAAPLDAKDVEFKRIEAQGLAEKLNAVVLEKHELQEALSGVLADNARLREEADGKAEFQERLAAAQRRIDDLTMKNEALEANASDRPTFDAEEVDEAELEKTKLQAEVLRLNTDNNALGSSRAHLESELAKAREQIALYEEIEADRKAEAERGVRVTFDPEEVDEAELEAIADTWLKNSHSCGVETELPVVSYGEPAGLSPIYDESGFVIGASSPPPAFDPIATAEAVRDDLKAAGLDGLADILVKRHGVLNPPDNSDALPPPVGPEVSVEKRRGGVAAHPAVEKISDILRQDWPAGVAVSTIVSRIEREIEDRPAWANDPGRIGIHATKLGLKRPEGFRRNPVKAAPAPASAADFLSDAAASAALVPVVETPARDLRSLSRMAQLHGETVQRMADEGMTDGEIANEVNNTARRNDWLTAATAKSVRLEMERVR